jgi:heme-degrading monooxygenase HmoA
MFTKDFSKAPRFGQGTHMFFGGTKYAGILAMIQLAFAWPRVARAMRRSAGYRGHFLWYRFPFTFGNISLWDTREHMMAFARSQQHLDAIAWLVKPGTATGAFVRLLKAYPEGHSIGVWRAEDDGEAWRQPQLPFQPTSRRERRSSGHEGRSGTG